MTDKRTVKIKCNCGEEWDTIIDKPTNLYHCGKDQFSSNEDLMLTCVNCTIKRSITANKMASTHCQCRSTIVVINPISWDRPQSEVKDTMKNESKPIKGIKRKTTNKRIKSKTTKQ